MKRSKRLITLFLSLIFIFTLCLNIYAYTYVESYVTMTPDDLGNLRSINDSEFTDGILRKYYIKFTDVLQSRISFAYIKNDNTKSYGYLYQITSDENNIILIPSNEFNTNYTFYLAPTLNIDYTDNEFYVPIYCYNCVPYVNSDYSVYARIYNSTTTNEDILRQEYFNLGYSNGYNIGYNDGFDTASHVVADLPLVEKLSTFIASFTGEDTAQYIIPLSICMILILIYCLFIRWILNLARSSKLTRLTDIVVLVSCIAILLIYYIPMIDFTINQNQFVETVYTIASDVNVGG